MRSHRHTGDGRERIAYLQLRYGVRALLYLAKSSLLEEIQRSSRGITEAADRNKQVASSAWDFEMGAVEFVTPATSMGKQIYDFAKSNAGIFSCNL